MCDGGTQMTGEEAITGLAGDEEPIQMVVLELFWVKGDFENVVEVTVFPSKKEHKDFFILLSVNYCDSPQIYQWTL